MKAENANADNLQVLAMNTVKVLIIMTKLMTTDTTNSLRLYNFIMPCGNGG